MSGFFINKPQINRKLVLDKKIKPLKALTNKDFSTILFGAEGETRTLAPVSRPTPLAGAPRHQLEYFCKCNGFNHYLIKKRAVFNIQPAVAERVGFEPTVRCRTFSPGSRSSTMLFRITFIPAERVILSISIGRLVNSKSKRHCHELFLMFL